MSLNIYRSNGFECPPNIYQVGIGLNMIITSLLCSLTQLISSDSGTNILYGFLFYGSLFLVVLYWAKASISDPTDPVVIANREAILKNLAFDSSRYDSMCTICSTSVGNTSKHCGACNRCVEKFDHHCIWLNNCIGRKNYNLFIKLIVLVTFHEIIILSFSVKIIVNYFAGDEIHTLGANLLGIQIYLVVQSGAIILFLGNLILLHIWLYRKGLTTYELIKIRSKGKRKVHTVLNSEPSNSRNGGIESSKRSNIDN
jgi:palmitoyltransferase ZDHHC1/11